LEKNGNNKKQQRQKTNRYNDSGTNTMPFLQKGRQTHRLQGYRDAAETFDQPRQDIFAQAQRQLRKLPEKSKEGY
jgi:hypothetical protein